MKTRCEWCGDNPRYMAYHNKEWGVPQHDDRLFIEFLVLESAQAGLSWLTILKKRENHRKVLHGSDIEPAGSRRARRDLHQRALLERSAGPKGGHAIDLLVQVMGMSFNEAMEKLEEFM